MQKIKLVLYKLKIFYNKVFCIIYKNKFKKKIAIVSSDKHINKVKEDIMLKIELNKRLIDVDIISWQDKSVNYKLYDFIIIRSVWGYQDHIDEFISWLNNLKKENVKVINDIDVIFSNYNKYVEFNILDKYNIPHIKTYFIEKEDINKIKDIYDKYKEIVIKPCISGSGNNTYIISNKEYKNSIRLDEIRCKFENIFNDYNKYLMVQPFIKEINNGEISVVVINKKISHSCIRYINVFNDINQIKILDKLDNDIIEIVNKCINIKEYDKALFMRIDLVKIGNEYKIMEVELIEPQLFLEYNKNKDKLINFVDEINMQ